MMKRGGQCVRAAFVAALLLVVSACDNERPVQTAEQKTDATRQRLDRAAETAGEKMQEAAESAGKAMERASDQLATSAKDAAAKTVHAVDDATITAKVKAALYAEPGLKTLQIDVATNDKVVTLAGSVDSEALRKRAVQIAGSLAGVDEVVDKLVVKAS